MSLCYLFEWQLPPNHALVAAATPIGNAGGLAFFCRSVYTACHSVTCSGGQSRFHAIRLRCSNYSNHHQVLKLPGTS